MSLTFQMVLVNVMDLQRSTDFYSEVLGLPVVSGDDEVVTLMVNRGRRNQVLVLRKTHGRSHPGRSAIGATFVGYEADSIEELDLVEAQLEGRSALVGRRRTDSWEAVIGFDPDRIPVSVAANPGGGPISVDDWMKIDASLYVIGN